MHYYEEQGLIKPALIDKATNYRYYSAEQLGRINTIKMLQQIDIPLAIIKEIITEDHPDSMKKYYHWKKLELTKEMEILKKKQQLIDMMDKQMEKGQRMNKYNVLIKEIPRRKVMSIRKKIQKFDDETKLWGALFHQSQEQQIQLTTPPSGMTIYHDLEYVETDIDIEVQSNIVGDYVDNNDIHYYEALDFKMAAVTFNGSFEQMPEVTSTVAAWIEVSDYTMTGKMVNIPIVSGAVESNPENWITEAGFIIV